jgi:hypothetical protein
VAVIRASLGFAGPRCRGCGERGDYAREQFRPSLVCRGGKYVRRRAAAEHHPVMTRIGCPPVQVGGTPAHEGFQERARPLRRAPHQLGQVGWRQAGTSGLLPVTMLGAGICGLWAAASMARSWAASGFSVWNGFTVLVKIPGPIPPTGSPGAAYVRAASQTAAKLPPAIAAQGRFANFAGSGRSWRVVTGPIARPVAVARPHVVIPGHSLWWGRLLILGSLLLALGLWLSPRAVADLRALITRVAPRLRRWTREGNWGILLVPVTSFGLTIFGVRPWTVAAIVAAIVITIRWPRLAADLVPLVLVVFAVYGFMLVSR